MNIIFSKRFIALIDSFGVFSLIIFGLLYKISFDVKIIKQKIEIFFFLTSFLFSDVGFVFLFLRNFLEAVIK